MGLQSRVYTSLFLVLCLGMFTQCRQSINDRTDGQGMTSQGGSAADAVAYDLDSVLNRGTIRAIVENSSTGFFIYKGKPMGYEHDLLAFYAESRGLQLEIVVTNSLDEAFDMLDDGRGDVIAFPLTITKERKERANFTDSHYTTRQVLVQRKPENWLQFTRDELNDKLIREQTDLAGHEIYVRKSSSYTTRLENLSEEIGADILIIEIDTAETEELIRMVANNEIPITVADESVARVNAAYYPGIDVETPISFAQNIAWAVRPNAPQMLGDINLWLDSMKMQPTYNVIYNKYFKNTRKSKRLANSDYSSMGGEKISPYDEIIQAAADTLNWDWRLLASQVFQESKFNSKAVSWAGAVGLMQLVPETGHRYGAKVLTDPQQNIMAGAAFLEYLDGVWSKTIKDPQERLKFVLASYNVGLGHVADARDLAIKFGKDPLVWEDNVEYYLLHKSEPEFFNDPVVNSGYCRGEEPVNYVREILNRYEQYKQLIPTNS